MLITEWGEALDRSAPLPRNTPGRSSCAAATSTSTAPGNTPSRRTWKKPEEYAGEIVRPSPPSRRSPAWAARCARGEYLWYRRRFTLPEGFKHRPACCCTSGPWTSPARVWVNGHDAVAHTGGYLPFSADITELLEDGENTLLVRCADDTDESWHTRGKQENGKKGGIWYTPLSGIWQTVWCESVPENYIKHLFITPTWPTGPWSSSWTARASAAPRSRAKSMCSPPGRPAVLELHGEDTRVDAGAPELDDLTLTLGEDRVRSYFAMRSFWRGDGQRRRQAGLLLNGRPYFHNGVLDRGWWPDGLYTAPSDEALAFDISAAKAMGFNMLRKHVKVEPRPLVLPLRPPRHARLQDMPNGGGKYNALTVSAPPAHGRATRATTNTPASAARASAAAASSPPS